LAFCLGAIAIAIALASAGVAGAQGTEEGSWSFRGGLGFTATPETFVLSGEFPYAIDDHMTLGPLIQLGVSDPRVILAPTANFTYAFDLGSAQNEDVQKLRPFLQSGLGLAYIHRDNCGVFCDEDDVGFLFNLGFGLEYPVSDDVTVGSNMLFNILAPRTAGERFFFTWNLVTVRFGL